MTTPTCKKSVRTELRRRRQAMTAAERHEEQLASRTALERLARLRSAVAGYAGHGDELDPIPWFRERWARGHAVFLPRVDGMQLVWHQVAAEEHLRLGWRGLREPDPACCPAVALPEDLLLIVPGVGFGPDGRRLGQGGGFYDRMLVNRRAGWCVLGLAWSCQWQDPLPSDAHDQRIDAILLGGVLYPGAGRPGCTL